MRKAFDANVPKLKPRLKTSMVVASESAPETGDESAQLFKKAPPPKAVRAVAFAAAKESKPDPEPASIENVSFSPATDETPDLMNESSSPAAPVNPAYDIDARRERLEKVKRKVAEAARTETRIEPVPEEPALAAESVLGLVSDLETQLSRTRDMEKALRTDLTEAKNELARTVTEGRAAAERLGQAEVQLDEKRKVLEEMLVEMGALEEERDQAVRRVQTLAAQDEERQKQLNDLGRRSAEMEKALSESKAEDERLSKELDECLTENAQLRAVLSEVTQERDGLARNVERLIKERDELIEAKKALEKVHKALSQARARLGN